MYVQARLVVPEPLVIKSFQTFDSIFSNDKTLFVSPELSSERDYVITHSVRSMYVLSMYVCTTVHMYVCSMYVVFCKIDHCIHIH